MYTETSVTFYEHPVVQCSSQQQSQLQADVLVLPSSVCCLCSAGGDEKFRTNLSIQLKDGKGDI